MQEGSILNDKATRQAYGISNSVATEVHWERLNKLLEHIREHGDDTQRRPVQEMAFVEHVELWNNDPAASAIYANKLFDFILNILEERRISPLESYQ